MPNDSTAGGMCCVRRGTGPSWLLLHGLGSSCRTWATVADALTAACRRD